MNGDRIMAFIWFAVAAVGCVMLLYLAEQFFTNGVG